MISVIFRQYIKLILKKYLQKHYERPHTQSRYILKHS